ncbi:MAG: hypothetical protein HYY23_20115 [Verrucomicrobia bacterium]|nr:hypothetical protein [Verrucomicrobiota bacterium]
MKRFVKSIVLAGVASAMLGGATSVMAQQRGNFDPEQFRQQMMERYQEQLGMTAEEFKAVQPLIESVQTKQRDATAFGRGGGAFGFSRGGGRGGGGAGGGQGRGGGFGFGGPPPAEVEALQKAVESGTPAEVKAKLEAYREARKKKETELQEAREKLRKVLTPKQEAQLVLASLLN